MRMFWRGTKNELPILPWFVRAHQMGNPRQTIMSLAKYEQVMVLYWKRDWRMHLLSLLYQQPVHHVSLIHYTNGVMTESELTQEGEGEYTSDEFDYTWFDDVIGVLDIGDAVVHTRKVSTTVQQGTHLYDSLRSIELYPRWDWQQSLASAILRLIGSGRKAYTCSGYIASRLSPCPNRMVRLIPPHRLPHLINLTSI